MLDRRRSSRSNAFAIIFQIFKSKIPHYRSKKHRKHIMPSTLTEPPSVSRQLGLIVLLLNIIFPGVGSMVRALNARLASLGPCSRVPGGTGSAMHLSSCACVAQAQRARGVANKHRLVLVFRDLFSAERQCAGVWRRGQLYVKARRASRFARSPRRDLMLSQCVSQPS
jgi:hypothetical protein